MSAKSRFLFLDIALSIKNGDLLDTWISSDRREDQAKILEKLMSFFKSSTLPDNAINDFNTAAHFFCLKINEFWVKSQRKRERLLKDYDNWFNKEIYMMDQLRGYTSFNNSNISNVPESSRIRGRPRKNLEECSLKTKRRRVAGLLANYTYEELLFAAEESKRISGLDRPTNADCNVLSPEQALSLYLDLDLSERKYNNLRSTVNSLHKDCFPSIYKLRDYKNRLLPKSINVTEIGAEVNLQELLDVTAHSVLKLLDDPSKLRCNASLTLLCKYGFDGSSGHSTYKQIFQNPNIHTTDEYFFFIAMSPLQLTDNENQKVLWNNPRPSSTHFCRPIKFMFVKESPVLVMTEESKLKSSISELQHFATTSHGKNVTVNYSLLLTMLDGSAINTLSETNSTQTCFLCGASPKEMNLESVVNKPIKQENLRFGLSSLHLWIRSFECLLHIAYRLPLQCWQVRGPERKVIFEQRKRHIQNELKNRMGLVVDKPKPGYGSTNDGNTARRFFSNPQLASSITGIDANLITQFSTILRTIASGQKINLETFVPLLESTKKLYLDLYKWYYMPTTIHKLLMHCTDIVNNFDIPIGQLSEDALEARHKEVRKQRLNHTRKSSRTNTNKDLMTALLITSDPYVSSLRTTSTSRTTDLSDIKDYIILDNTWDSTSTKSDDDALYNFEQFPSSSGNESE